MRSFDLVALSVGLTPPASAPALAEIFGAERTVDGFLGRDSEACAAGAPGGFRGRCRPPAALRRGIHSPRPPWRPNNPWPTCNRTARRKPMPEKGFLWVDTPNPVESGKVKEIRTVRREVLVAGAGLSALAAINGAAALGYPVTWAFGGSDPAFCGSRRRSGAGPGVERCPAPWRGAVARLRAGRPDRRGRGFHRLAPGTGGKNQPQFRRECFSALRPGPR